MYFHIAGGREQATTAPLVAPGDIWITHVRANYGSTQDSVDYSIHFAICQDVFGYFNHVKEISPALQRIIDAQGCPEGAIPGSRDCTVQVLEPIAAGAAMGGVGMRQGNFDLGIWDVWEERSTANQERYQGRSLHIRCPLDYFTNVLREALNDLIPEEAEGNCGTVSYDIDGTLQGNWFLEGVPWAQDDAAVFFGYDNVDPSQAIVSVGGRITKPGKMEFAAQEDGLTNRRFDDVTAGGQVYCYQRDGTGRTESFSEPGNLIEGHILVMLSSASDVQVEHQGGNCPSVRLLDTPTTYNR